MGPNPYHTTIQYKTQSNTKPAIGKPVKPKERYDRCRAKDGLSRRPPLIVHQMEKKRDMRRQTERMTTSAFGKDRGTTLCNICRGPVVSHLSVTTRSLWSV